VVRRRTLLAGAVGVSVLALTGCAGTVAKPGDLSRLRIMAPASLGGGWDTTARLLQRVIRSTGLARNVQVFNVEGAGAAGAGHQQRGPVDPGRLLVQPGGAAGGVAGRVRPPLLRAVRGRRKSEVLV